MNVERCYPLVCGRVGGCADWNFESQAAGNGATVQQRYSAQHVREFEGIRAIPVLNAVHDHKEIVRVSVELSINVILDLIRDDQKDVVAGREDRPVTRLNHACHHTRVPDSDVIRRLLRRRSRNCSLNQT